MFEFLVSALFWVPVSIALAFNNSEVSLGEAYQFVCARTGGDWHNPVPADLQAQYGKAYAGCYYAEGEYPILKPQEKSDVEIHDRSVTLLHELPGGSHELSPE